MFPALTVLVVAQASQCNAQVPEMLFERALMLPAVNSHEDLTEAKLKAIVNAQTSKLCRAPAVFDSWAEWERVTYPVDDTIPVYPRQKELDAWLDEGVKGVVLALNDGKPDADSLTGDALCARAMEA